jgi:hypothetical protein
MKNHWLRIHEQKKRRFWTAEFSRNGLFVLRPRKVEVIDPKHTLGCFGATSGTAEIHFNGAMMNATDNELLDFLSETRKGMKNWMSRLRLYANLTSELEYFELTNLNYNNISVGKSIDDISFKFDYKSLRHIYCA